MCTTPLPVLKELVLSLKMSYHWSEERSLYLVSSMVMLCCILTNVGTDPCIQQQGLGTSSARVSLWDVELTKPPSQTYTKFLGMEPTDTGYIHDTHRCMRAFRKPSRFSSSQDIIPYIFIVPHQSQQV